MIIITLTVGKRYEWTVTIPSDGRCKNGLLVSIDNKDMATLMTKDGQEWYVHKEELKPIK